MYARNDFFIFLDSLLPISINPTMEELRVAIRVYNDII